MTRILKILLFVFISTISLHAGVQKVTANYIVVQTAGTKYVGNASNQTYSINPTSIGTGSHITIIDQGGSNTIELVGGLAITSSQVVYDELILTLSNGATVNIRGADTFTFDVGANQASGTTGTKKTFNSFVTSTLGLASVPTRGQAAVGGDNNSDSDNDSDNDQEDSDSDNEGSATTTSSTGGTTTPVTIPTTGGATTAAPTTNGQTHREH